MILVSIRSGGDKRQGLSSCCYAQTRHATVDHRHAAHIQLRARTLHGMHCAKHLDQVSCESRAKDRRLDARCEELGVQPTIKQPCRRDRRGQTSCLLGRARVSSGRYLRPTPPHPIHTPRCCSVIMTLRQQGGHTEPHASLNERGDKHGDNNCYTNCRPIFVDATFPFL